MAVSSRAVAFLLLSAASMAGLMGACRSTRVCRGAGCTRQEVPIGGAAGAPGAMGGAAGQELGGESGSAGAESGAGGEGATRAGLTCDPDMADCDGSRLTGCEANLTWNARHCGACGQLCDGLCLAGVCQPTLMIEPVYVQSMVATTVTGYATASGNGFDLLLKIALEDGNATALLQDLEWPHSLALSGDRVYVLDATPNLRSLALDGSDLKTEVAVAPNSVGGTALGAYYVDVLPHDEKPEYEPEYQLLFRATGSSKWELLLSETRPLRILSSTPAGMVLARYADWDEELAAAEVSIWNGKSSELLAERPKSFRQLKVVSNGTAVALTADDETGEAFLWWKEPGDAAAKAFPLGAPSDDVGDDILVYADSVAVHFDSNGRAYVQQFDLSGATPGRLGVLPNTHPVWMDSHLWYAVADNWIKMRFLRSDWFDLDF